MRSIISVLTAGLKNTEHSDAAKAASSTTPAVDVDLVRSVTQNGVTLEEVVDVINLSASNSWRHTWGDLPQSGSIRAGDGTTVGGEYTYFVREKVPLGFSVAYSPNEDGSAPLNGTVFITNTEQSQLKVEKVWGDGAEEQEIQFKLWRRRTENTNPATCPKCGQQVGTETAHQSLVVCVEQLLKFGMCLLVVTQFVDDRFHLDNDALLQFFVPLIDIILFAQPLQNIELSYGHMFFRR